MMLKMSERRTHGKQVISQVDEEKGKNDKGLAVHLLKESLRGEKNRKSNHFCPFIFNQTAGRQGGEARECLARFAGHQGSSSSSKKPVD